MLKVCTQKPLKILTFKFAFPNQNRIWNILDRFEVHVTRKYNI